jgi:hypothetical protein
MQVFLSLCFQSCSQKPNPELLISSLICDILLY